MHLMFVKSLDSSPPLFDIQLNNILMQEMPNLLLHFGIAAQ